MTTPKPDRFDEMADKIIDKGFNEWGELCLGLSTLSDAIAAALRSMLPPKGHIIDDDGVVRKVLGTLPITADGCVAMPGQWLHFPGYGQTAFVLRDTLTIDIAIPNTPHDGTFRDARVDEAYSLPISVEAAESAAQPKEKP